MARIGNLRERVTIQTLETSRDGFGGIVETWETMTTVWASVQNITGREVLAAQQTNAEISHRVTMRYLDNVVPTMRLLWGTRILDINAALDADGRGRWLELLCVEKPFEEYES